MPMNGHRLKSTRKPKTKPKTKSMNPDDYDFQEDLDLDAILVHASASGRLREAADDLIRRFSFTEEMLVARLRWLRKMDGQYLHYVGQVVKEIESKAGSGMGAPEPIDVLQDKHDDILQKMYEKGDNTQELYDRMQERRRSKNYATPNIILPNNNS